MCAYLLRSEREQKHGRLYMANEKAFDWVLSLYRGTLRWVLDNPTPTLIVLFLTIALNVVLIVKIPKGFFPEEDTGAITGGVQGPQDSSFPAMNDAIQQIGGVIKNDPAIANVIAFTGGNGATNTGNLYVALQPLSTRNVSAAQIIDRLRPQLTVCRWPRRSSKPCRICASAAGLAMPCTNTRSKATMCRISPSGDQSYWPR